MAPARFVDVFKEETSKMKENAVALIITWAIILKNYSSQAQWIFSNYWMRLSMIWRIMQIEEGVIRLSLRLRRITPSEICIILHIIRKPNSIIVLLFIQNISRALKILSLHNFLIGFCRVHGKITRYLKTMNKKQEKSDQKNFIQGSDKFAVRSKIRMNFLRVRSPRNTI